MTEEMPRTFLRLRVLYIFTSPAMPTILRKGGRYIIRTPDGNIQDVKVLDVIVKEGTIYPLQLLGTDPEEYLREVCSNNQIIVAEFLHASGFPVEQLPKLEVRSS
jgi:hypothetical protein